MKRIIILLLISSLIISGCSKKEENNLLFVNQDNECKDEFQEYYSRDDRKIYLVCTDEVYVNEGNELVPLEFYLNISSSYLDDTIDSLVKDFNKYNIYDGGSIMYKSDDMSVLKCNTLDGNKDIYIGKKDMQYENNYCKDQSKRDGIKRIVDKTDNIKDFTCASALEEFYEDEDYKYYFNCIKGDYVAVIYKDGKEKVSDALKNGTIWISDLDKYHIDYMKEKKEKPLSEVIGSSTADYLYSLKTVYTKTTEIKTLLNRLRLNFYGHYIFYIDNNRLTISYLDIEGWGNLLEKEDILLDKTSIILSLITGVDEVNYKTNSGSKLITKNDLEKYFGNIKEYGLSQNNMKELLIKLGYFDKEEEITMNAYNVTNKSLHLHIENLGDINYQYGQEYLLEVYINGKWQRVKSFNTYFNSMAYNLQSKDNIDIEISFKSPLENGRYRVVKSFDEVIDDGFGKEHYLIAEFKI